MRHELKTWPAPFQAMWDGYKIAEFRKDDRGFQEGDDLLLREYDPDTQEYLGRAIEARIKHIQKGFGIPDGYAMLSLQLMWRVSPKPPLGPVVTVP